MENTNQTPSIQQPEFVKRSVVDEVLIRINEFQETKSLTLPEDYSPENALKSALLILQELKNKDGVVVLESCTRTSIANALFKMVVSGLNPMKMQGYFIPYGKELTFQRSYQGSIALAKRVGDVKSVVSQTIYTEDVFEYEIDSITGRRKLLKHEQKMENIDISKIRGAYAIITFNSGESDLVVMTLNQIHKAWDQGQMKGKSGAHTNFTDQMCERTVINRACKKPINSSSDSNLYMDKDEDSPTVQDQVKKEISQEANTETINFTDVTEKIQAPEKAVKEDIAKEKKEPEIKKGF